MGENVNQFRIGDIRSTRHIGGASQKNPIVAEDPFETVIRNEADMLSRLKAERNESCRQV